MCYRILICMAGMAMLSTVSFSQQPGRQPSVQFPQVTQLVGKQLPDIKVLDSQGNPMSTSDLRGRHTVLVFGCLT